MLATGPGLPCPLLSAWRPLLAAAESTWGDPAGPVSCSDLSDSDGNAREGAGADRRLKGAAALALLPSWHYCKLLRSSMLCTSRRKPIRLASTGVLRHPVARLSSAVITCEAGPAGRASLFAPFRPPARRGAGMSAVKEARYSLGGGAAASGTTLSRSPSKRRSTLADTATSRRPTQGGDRPEGNWPYEHCRQLKRMPGLALR